MWYFFRNRVDYNRDFAWYGIGALSLSFVVSFLRIRYNKIRVRLSMKKEKVAVERIVYFGISV